MSAVKRYGHISYLVEACPQIMKLYPSMTVYVLASDFDRVTAERDAMQQHLNAADQRIDELTRPHQDDSQALIDLHRQFIDREYEDLVDQASDFQDRAYALGLARGRLETAALREELAKANEKIDQAWNRSHSLDHKGFIPGALDAWKRPVPQHLPYDLSGNPGASATQYCNGWNESGGYWSGHASDLQQRLIATEQRNAGLVASIVALPDEFKELSGCENTAGVYACIDYISDWVAELSKPTESGASE